MKWRGRRASANVEDRRGGRRAVAGGGLSIGVILLIAASIFFPEAVPFLRMFGVGQPGVQQEASGPGVDDDTKQFVGVTLADTEEVWHELFAQGAFDGHPRYQPPKLVLFTGGVRSPCGAASSSSGPFYCPADGKIYIDPSFYRVMERQLKAPGDFAQAYVIAHEVGHHVQNIIGLLPEVQRRRMGLSRVDGNRLTVRLELQADCFSGVWATRAHQKFGSLEAGDMQEALRAAYQVGDDVLQRMQGGRVDESSFTHGSAVQRERWFRIGAEAGDPRVCDTFTPGYNQL